MHIVILDEVELSDGQKSRLEALGDLTAYDTNPVSPDETVERLKDADIAILGWTQLDAACIDKLPKLRMISIWATGYNYVDISHALSKGITVTNVPGYAATAVAELTLGLMLALSRHMIPAYESVRGGSYSWHDFQGRELRGKTLGVVGVGHIGGQVIKLAKSFGMKILAVARDTSSRRADLLEVQFTDLATLLKESDFVSVQIPLTDATRGLIGKQELALMKPSAYIVSTSRDAVIDQTALREALKAGTLAGAALDEIAFPDEALAALPNVILTPHIGFFTEEALVRKGDICVTNIENFVAGDPTNVVTDDM